MNEKKTVNVEAKTLQNEEVTTSQVKEVAEPQVDNTEVAEVKQQVAELKADEPLIEDGAESKPLDEGATEPQDETEPDEPLRQNEDVTEVEYPRKLFVVANALKNILFIGGNRVKLNKQNVQNIYRKFKKQGFIESMSVEFTPISDANGQLEGRSLFQFTVKRAKSNEAGIFSDFRIVSEIVQPEDYHKYIGICLDGQHRLLALQLLKNSQKDGNECKAIVEQITIPEGMTYMQYIAWKNDVKAWINKDFLSSNMPTGDKYVDYIMAKMEEKQILAIFLFHIYTLGTNTLTANQVKSLMEGSQTMSDFEKVQLSGNTQKRGDAILETLINHPFIDKSRFTGRFAYGIKELYRYCEDIEQVKQVLEKIDKDVWEESFTAESGSSLERKAYATALEELHSEMFDN